ncbi:nose resistant to fluoxetine protein 6-like [Uloborus diversus]|uniref:nose resistant to fluoxetine protein 6-like n=1 Tax=Uloborus diversus TaxID=327109 RepID=UPI00240A3D52|nr:nose resistant to fluoxetine protein 6-like [Uloborus diversus]
MKIFLICAYLVLVFECAHGAVASDDELSPEDEEVVRQWMENFAKMKNAARSLVKAAMPYLMTTVSAGDLKMSPQCKKSLFQFIGDLRSFKPWAVRLVDSSAKMVTGVLTGSVASFGSYDQCLDTVSPNSQIQGQYCTIETRPPLPKKPRFYALNQRLKAFSRFENDTGMLGVMTKNAQLFYMFPFRIGICVPSTCSVSDVLNVSNFVVKKFFNASLTVPRCEVKEEVVIKSSQIPILIVIAVLAALVIGGTVIDYRRQNESELKLSQKDLSIGTKIAVSFSAISNWKTLMDVKTGADTLSVLQGIRVFSMFWVILGHTYFHLNFKILRNLQITIQLTSQFIFNSVTNASLVVDNFFFLSGLLVIYVGMDMEKKLGKVPKAIYFVIHRIWRYQPVQMFFVGIATLLPLFGDGPVWRENIDPIVEGCRNDWWANLVLINNVYRSGPTGCLSYSWYLAADFQIYVFCIPIIITIMKKPRIGLWLNGVALLLSILAAGIHNYIRDFPPTLLFTRADAEQRTQLMLETYYAPHTHLGPFCIGIFIGYYLQRDKQPLKIHWISNVAAWVLAFVFMCSALFGVHPWNSGTGATGVVPTVLYASLARIAWTLSIAWMTVACTKGCGGFLTSVLRWKALIPLSRLTFLVYMVHPFIQHILYSNLREGIQAKNHLAVFLCIGFITVSYVFAAILCLLLEAPIINIGKLILEVKESLKKKKKLHSRPILKNDVNALDIVCSNGDKFNLTSNGHNGLENHCKVKEKDIECQLGELISSNHKGEEEFICHL